MATFQKALVYSLLFICLLLVISEAKDIIVGGNTNSWKIPSSESNSLNQWAEKSRFRVGDSLVWKYDGQKDSVLQVTKENYLACNTSNVIEEYKDGSTKVELDRSGPFYFISGAEGHCEKGQKLVVVVLSQRHGGRFNGFFYSAPAPSPVEFVGGPAVAPTSDAPLRLASVAVVATALCWSLGFVFM